MKTTAKKRGFTIVELVIVIAVIAILAAVLIPTFTGVIRKARESSDIQLVRNLNTAVAAEKVINGSFADIDAVVKTAADAGFDLGKIKAAAKSNYIMWDSVNEMFCYFDSDKNEVTYLPESEDVDEENAYYWAFSSTLTPYNTYLSDDAQAPAEGLDAKVGVHVGNSGITVINYTTDAAATATFYTKGGTLTINAPKATVNHYGEADSVIITAVADASYHAYGSVEKLEVVKGRVVVEDNANVYAVVVADANAANVKLDVVGEVGVLYAPEALVVSGDAPAKSSIITDETTGWKLVGTKDELTAALASDATKIALKNDIAFNHAYADGPAVFVVARDVELNLNSYSINVNFVCSSSDKATNVSLFQVNGGKTFTVSGSGKMEFEQIGNNFGWSGSSSVIESNVSTVVVNDSVIIRHRGGSDMAYAIDSRSGMTPAFVTVNGGLIESPYRSIRAFCNSSANANTITINGGTVRSLKNNAIWMHDASKNNNKGILNITGGVIESMNGSKPVNIAADTAFDITTNVTGGTFKSNGSVVTGDAIYKK